MCVACILMCNVSECVWCVLCVGVCVCVECSCVCDVCSSAASTCADRPGPYLFDVSGKHPRAAGSVSRGSCWESQIPGEGKESASQAAPREGLEGEDLYQRPHPAEPGPCWRVQRVQEGRRPCCHLRDTNPGSSLSLDTFH